MSQKILDDNELKKMLKTYAPIPPAPDTRLLSETLQKLDLEKKPDRRSVFWLALCSSLAFGVFALLWASGRPTLNQDRPAESAEVAINLIEEDDELIESEAPTLDVGEDYLKLVVSM